MAKGGPLRGAPDRRQPRAAPRRGSHRRRRRRGGEAHDRFEQPTRVAGVRRSEQALPVVAGRRQRLTAVGREHPEVPGGQRSETLVAEPRKIADASSSNANAFRKSPRPYSVPPWSVSVAARPSGSSSSRKSTSSCSKSDAAASHWSWRSRPSLQGAAPLRGRADRRWRPKPRSLPSSTVGRHGLAHGDGELARPTQCAGSSGRGRLVRDREARARQVRASRMCPRAYQ